MQLKVLISLLVLLTCQAVENNIGIKITVLDSPLSDLLWCGDGQQNDQNVLVLTNKGSVYKSQDRGDTWEKMTEYFQLSALKALNSLDVKAGVVNQITKSLVDPNLVIFLGTEGIHWITEDCGQTIRSLGRGKHLRDFQYHPVERNWMIASAWTTCFKSSEDKPCLIAKELYVTKDLGQNWEQIASYVVQFSWGMNTAKNNDQIPIQRIIWSQELNAVGHQKTGSNRNTHLFYSDDFLRSKKMIVSQGNKFLLQNSYLFVVQIANADEQKVNLLVANSNSATYDFSYANINDDLKQHSFTILDSSEGQVFVNINSYKPDARIGNVYQSDSTGTRFSLSLKDNVKDSDGQCDFEKVFGIEGVYISNHYDSQRVEKIKSLVMGDEDAIQVENKKNKKTQSKEDINDIKSSLNNFKKSKITFDKGGIWKPINPPKVVNGKKYNCTNLNECSLHLNLGSSRSFGPLYSNDNSVGLIIATGNVGKYLANRVDQINTYLSRDSGLTWFEVLGGSSIYEIGDHGGLIVMATDQKATNQLFYTMDEGLTVNEVKFWDEEIEITNIITEPFNLAQRFIIHGETSLKPGSSEQTQGVVVSFDFSQMNLRQCEGADTPDTKSSDYETWTPNGQISQDCLMGKKVTYSRRKRDSICFNGEQFERKISVQQCECTEEDWECDIGFQREGDGPCLKTDGQEIDYNAPESCSTQSSYQVSQGYRRIGGDQCIGGVQHTALVLPCPFFGFLSSDSQQNFLVLVLIFGFLYYLYKKDKKDFKVPKSLDFIFKRGQKKNEGSNKYIDFSKIDFEQNDNDNKLVYV